MMTRQQYLLFQLAEEAAEVAQRASKAARFGMSEIQPGHVDTNRERLVGELNDLIAVANELLVDQWVDSTQLVAKAVKIETYMGYSRSLGMVE